MELVRVDTQKAYEAIREKITQLELAPGALIDANRLAQELETGLNPVQEALKLLAHEDLVRISPRHGIYVSEVNVEDLQQISEARLALETLAARLAAQRATPDDVAVLRALCQEQTSVSAGDARRLFALDHRFHQAIARAAHNRYLARTLEHFFGLSQRLWYLVLPHLDFLPAAVEEHLQLVQAIEEGRAEEAEKIMGAHVQDFYVKVHDVLDDREELYART